MNELTTTNRLPAQSALVPLWLSGRSENTLRAYRRSLEAYVTHCATESGDAVRDLLSQGAGHANWRVTQWRSAMVDSGISPNTINARLSAVRSLVDLAKTVGLIAWSLSVPNVKARAYRDTRGCGLAGVRKMIEHLEGETGWKAARDLAIVRMLHDCGLRRGEVAALDMASLDLVKSTVMVVGKGNRDAEPISVPAATMQAIRQWIEHRGEEPGPLFLNCNKTRLSTTSIYRMVRKVGDWVGVDVRPHGLRHSAITTALDLTDGNVRKVAAFSRHAKLDTLMVYDDKRRDFGGEVADAVSRAS